MTETFLLPNSQLTRTGEVYPPWKIRKLDELQQAAAASSPRALSAVDTAGCKWAWDHQRFRATWSRTGNYFEPEPHRLIAVLDVVKLDAPRPYLTVYPYYREDALRVDNNFYAHRRPFDPSHHIDGEMLPVPVWMPKAYTPPPAGSLYQNTRPYSHVVRDLTDCNFNRPGDLIPPAAIHKHDLVILEVTIHLEANFTTGPAAYALCANSVKLVHIASDHAAHLSLPPPARVTEPDSDEDVDT